MPPFCPTPGAVSRQVKQLESRLGVALFERHANGVLLTEAGKVLLEDVQAGLSLIASGVEQITQRSSEAFELVIRAPRLFCSFGYCHGFTSSKHASATSTSHWMPMSI